MINQQTCFTAFNASIENYSLPERFTFPFCYQPHPLCILASQELQQQLENNQQYQQLFAGTGKMFGVLIVKNKQDEIGYLAAFSGKLVTHAPRQTSLDVLLNDSTINFVPAIFDIDEQGDFFHSENLVINQLNAQVEKLVVNLQLQEYQHELNQRLEQQNEQLEQHRHLMTINKQARKIKRSQVRATLAEDKLAERLKQLAQASINDKNQLRDLKLHWSDVITQAQQKLMVLTDEINAIKTQRKKLSIRLQKKLFKKYRLLNSAGIEKDVFELFKESTFPIPPAGTGDCAAPKLLQYAFQQDLTPLAMAEFWWGQAPKSEIRQHKNFYAACSGKCQPILPHMLAGIDVDENPLLKNPAQGKALPIIYQDEHIVVVNKPNEFLSVPGKNIEDSVYLRIKQQFPQATGSLIVHRLDMSTSGVMVLALTKRGQKDLQQQFIKRLIKKRYIALLEGDIGKISANLQGEINLPLRGDLDDRPRQRVCYEQGKQAKTTWQVIDTIEGKTKLYLYPETGRTHQLRVHCAHPQGLNLPILGDDLYGHQTEQRLHLHAQRLVLNHPVTKKTMTFEVDADF
ncbi:MAG: RNA pseudouridine synthase [Colwellia sp.]|nr:RNA pseudouridine synthase [Colwellia sp.]